MNRQTALSLGAAVLLILGAYLSLAEVVRWTPQPSFELLTGPVQIDGETLSIVDVDGDVGSLRLGDAPLIEGIERVGATSDNPGWHARYVPLFYLARVPTVASPVGIVEIPRPAVLGEHHIRFLPAIRGKDVATIPVGDELNMILALGVIPHARWQRNPGPLLLAAGLALLVAVRRPRAAATLLLVTTLLGLASVIGWPLIMGDPRRLVPVVALASLLVLLVALAAGPRAERWASMGGVLRRLFCGGAIGAVLLGVFVFAFVNISGFIAPVFRPPDASLTPGEWFANDLLRPAIAMLAAAVVPASLCGAIYGGRLGR